MKFKIVSKFINHFICFILLKKFSECYLNWQCKGGQIFFLIYLTKTNYIRNDNSFIDYFLLGLIKGYKVYLELRGTGYKARMISNNYLFGLILRLGFSHLIYLKFIRNFRISFFNRSILCFYSNNFTVLHNKVKSIQLQKRINVYKGKDNYLEK